MQHADPDRDDEGHRDPHEDEEEPDFSRKTDSASDGDDGTEEDVPRS